MAPGKFITLEGGEGAGKSTHAQLLADTLRAAGIEVVLSREPGGSPGAEEIRALLVSGAPDRWSATSELLLHSAARADHLEKTVRPALARGAWVVSDRFADSTLAYQGHGHGLDLAAIGTVQCLVLGGTEPDLTLILDVAAATGLARADGRGTKGEDRYERMDAAFHGRLRDGFRAIHEAEPERCRLIDTARPVEAVRAAILEAVAARFGLDLS